MGKGERKGKGGLSGRETGKRKGGIEPLDEPYPTERSLLLQPPPYASPPTAFISL